MAEGYSIAEAAKLLGVPQRRVMQLLERGVLTAVVDERRRWRVYLAASDAAEVAGGTLTAEPERPPSGRTRQARSASEDAEQPADSNGDHFSQLLAELRHLQERYGQALLALGEARGEVSALRSRVELLEGGPAIAIPQPDPGPKPPAPAPAPVPRPEAGRRRRVRPPGAAAGLADALARADDPSPAELPGGREAARALEALTASQASVSAPAAPAAPEARDAQPVTEATPTPADRGIGRLRRWLGR